MARPQADDAFTPLIVPPPPQGLYGTLDPAIAGRLVNQGTTVPAVYNPQPPTGSGGGGGGGGVSDPASIDWADVYFGQYGLPADLKAQIEALGQKYGTSNPDVFFQSAQNVVRQSDWFKTTYPGFFEGVRAGLFTDETGYRSYLNALNQVYKQYVGRDVSGSEAASHLATGANPTLVANQFQGDAIAKTNANEWQYLSGAFSEGAFSASDNQTLGRELAGIDTPLGQQLQKRLQQASQRAEKIFSGTLATPSLSLGANGLNAPSLLGRNRQSDVAA